MSKAQKSWTNFALTGSLQDMDVILAIKLEESSDILAMPRHFYFILPKHVVLSRAIVRIIDLDPSLMSPEIVEPKYQSATMRNKLVMSPCPGRESGVTFLDHQIFDVTYKASLRNSFA